MRVKEPLIKIYFYVLGPTQGASRAAAIRIPPVGAVAWSPGENRTDVFFWRDPDRRRLSCKRYAEEVAWHEGEGVYAGIAESKVPCSSNKEATVEGGSQTEGEAHLNLRTRQAKGAMLMALVHSAL